jgi:dipeptidyl aminopeptidase/acylaminoacyl peptidase
MMKKKIFRNILVFYLVILVCSFYQFAVDTDTLKVFSAKDVLGTRTCDEAVVSPDGQWIAYTVNTPRDANDKPGPAYEELYLISTQTREIKPFITGKVSINSLRWHPDSSSLAFLTRRGTEAKTQVWRIPIYGGEEVQVTDWETGVQNFEWHPKENKIAFIATAPNSKKEKELEEKGYQFIFYEENLKHRNLYLMDLDKKESKKKVKQITTGKTVWDFVFSPDGRTIAASISPKNLVDHSYMFQKIYLLDLKTGALNQLTDNQGKLGNFEFSPDGSRIAYTAALERKDHAVSQVYVFDIKTRAQKNLTIPEFRGHVNRVMWKDKNTIMYLSGEGVWPTLSQVPAAGGNRKVILHAQKAGVTFRRISFSKDFKHAAFSGSAPHIPGDLFYLRLGEKPERLITLNPWIAQRKLGTQKPIRYHARDGLEIEGILVLPVDYKEGDTYPLIVSVHGGPESHFSMSWLTQYSSPAQMLAGKGYVVFYPNYRASTGYGLKFALEGYKDPAGKEFDDIADGIDYLVKQGIVDKERVGLGGGSYGGYAAAWFASYYTGYVRAVCMFVGISDIISKRGTTDIPYEELYVHSGDPLEKMWKLNLERSPIYWAHQSRSAVLILGGTDDTRVHPSQSLEFYRRLKMNDHPAVRLVQYPGEGHGNRNQPGRIDVLYRILQWYDWYVKDKKPLDGSMPPLDISENYGLK